MKVTNNQLLTVERICNKYGKERNGKVAWLMARNKSKISGPLEDMREILKPTPAIEEYNQACVEIRGEFAEKDEDGNPKQEINPQTGQPQVRITRLGAYFNAVEKMLDEYPQAKADRDELEEKTQDLLGEVVDIDFYVMNLKKIPGFRDEKDEDNGIIEANDLMTLFDMGIVYEEDNVAALKAAK